MAPGSHCTAGKEESWEFKLLLTWGRTLFSLRILPILRHCVTIRLGQELCGPGTGGGGGVGPGGPGSRLQAVASATAHPVFHPQHPAQSQAHHR